MEQSTAEYLSWALNDDRIERRHLSGAKDRGDINGVRFRGNRVVIECKDHGGRISIADFLRQAEEERGNDDALIGVAVCKRRGVGIETRKGQGCQLVLMTLETFALLLNDGLPLGPENNKEQHND